MGFLLLAFFVLPSFALADTIVVSNPITSDTIWSPPNVYVIDTGFSISAGVTLTINPGTILKVRAVGYYWPSIYGKVIAHGTSTAPIYFTSINDDSVGGDTSGNGPSAGAPGDWQGLYFKSGSEGSFDYVNISYAGLGGYGQGDYVGIENDGGILDIKHSNIHDNYIITSNGAGGSWSVGSGIYNKSGTLSVSNSIIDNNVWGIRVDSGTTTISNNIIKNNADSTGYNPGYGVYAFGPEPLTLINNAFSNNRRTANISASKNFTHNGNTSEDHINRGFEMSGIISEDTTFNSEDLPLILNYLTIEAGKTLTIEPGTILKMSDYYSSGSIMVYGNLVAKGTPDKKIYITSLKDDSIGGDTNGDGDTSFPGPRNWNALYLETGSKAEFDNVVLRYSGYNYNGEYLPGVAAAIYQRGAEFLVSSSLFERNQGTAIFQDAGTTDISNSELINGDYGIWSRGGNITISQSNISDNFGVSIYNQNGPAIDARNNWWGSADGPYDTSTTTPTGTGDKISGDVLYIPFLTQWPPIQEQTINPVIIIPGIMGSAYKDGVWTIDPVFHVYDNLIETLENNGYSTTTNLFPFGYDWKNSNTDTAIKLKEKIDKVKGICDCDKVDIVAHSMGGLVARVYAQSADYDNDIDQLIFLGTPHRGAPKDYLTWEAGEIFGKDAQTFFLRNAMQKDAKQHGYTGDNTLFDYVKGWPIISVQELLPTYDYLKDANTNQLLAYPTGYPENDFLVNLNQDLIAFLESDIDVTNIIGNTGASTISTIRITDENKLPLWEHGYPENYDSGFGDKGIEAGIGDGTVPEYSSKFNNPFDLEISSSHTNLPTDAEEEIYAEIHGGELVDAVKTPLPLRILFAKIFSPADFVIIAPDNKRVGKDFVTGQEINEIPGAFYSGFNTDDEYVTIPDPTDGEYQVRLRGTGSGGSYSFETTYISDGISITKEVSGITAPDQIIDLNIEVDNDNPETISSERVVTLDVLISDINGAYDLGWIKDKKTRDGLIKEAKLIIKFEKRRDGKYEKKIDKIIIKLIEKELDLLLKKNKINKQAHDLLEEDLNYIINNN